MRGEVKTLFRSFTASRTYRQSATVRTAFANVESSTLIARVSGVEFVRSQCKSS